MDLEITAAICLLSVFLLVAAQGYIWLTISFVCMPIFLLFYYYKIASKTRSRFFVGWSLASFFFLNGVFELEVVPYLEILFIENFMLMCFVSSLCGCVYLSKCNCSPSIIPTQVSERNKIEQVKRFRCEICSSVQLNRTYHCNLCGFCVPRKDHHCFWIDACINGKNQKFYIGALLSLLCACFYSSNLTLTTICHPTLLGGFLLMPDDCSDVFGDIHIAVCFVSAVYTLIIAAFAIYLFFLQLWLISHNSTYHEWLQGELGSYSKGVCRNFIEFFCGYT